MKVPLSPVELSTASAAINNVASFPSASDKLTGVALPKSGPTSTASNGLPLFPAYNDQSAFAWSSCEMDGCNAHVGQGFDYHYHGDPFGGNSTTCLYSAKNYTSVDAHPPFIGYSLDGFPIHGRHLSTTATGASTPLDDCALRAPPAAALPAPQSLLVSGAPALCPCRRWAHPHRRDRLPLPRAARGGDVGGGGGVHRLCRWPLQVLEGGHFQARQLLGPRPSQLRLQPRPRRLRAAPPLLRLHQLLRGQRLLRQRRLPSVGLAASQRPNNS